MTRQPWWPKNPYVGTYYEAAYQGFRDGCEAMDAAWRKLADDHPVVCQGCGKQLALLESQPTEDENWEGEYLAFCSESCMVDYWGQEYRKAETR